MSSDGNKDDLIAEIRSIEKEVLQSLEKVNSLAKIVKFLRHSEDEVVFQAVKSGQRVFTHFLETRSVTHNAVMSSKGVLVSAKGQEKQKEEESTAALAADPQYQVRTWIRKRYLEFCGGLVDLLSHEEAGLQLPALSALMEFERLAGQNGSEKLPGFRNVVYPYVVGVLVHSKGENEALLSEFREKYLSVFDDVRLYLFLNCTALIHSYNPSTRSYFVTPPSEPLKTSRNLPYLLNEDSFNESVYEILIDLNMASKPSHLNRFLVQSTIKLQVKDTKKNKKKRKRETQENEDSDVDLDAIAMDDGSEGDEASPQVSEKLLDLKVHRSAFSKAWLALLAKPLDAKLHLRVLGSLERQILPHMTSPVTLFDYLSQCYTSGGVLGMLSLGGLFVLLRKYNVEYPEFFPRLYSMFTPTTFYIKQRKRFFELSALFLEGANLPLYMLCAFVKRLSRLALTASPYGAMLMIAMVYRILLKHTATRILLHRSPQQETLETSDAQSMFPFLLLQRQKPMAEDPYNMEEPDPSKCRATESSLWEMKILTNHAVPAVATLAQLLFGSNELKAVDVDLQDFIEQSYQTMFESEYKRKTKNASFNFQLPTTLFHSHGSPFKLASKESLIDFAEAQLSSQISGPTSSAIYAEKKKRKTFAELKTERKGKFSKGTKRPRFAM
jgi:U3 small nucleolar RNA-associated protein 19